MTSAQQNAWLSNKQQEMDLIEVSSKIDAFDVAVGVAIYLFNSYLYW